MLVERSVRLNGLQALTGLQELACSKHRWQNTWSSAATAADHADLIAAESGLISAFPKLRCLTCLELKGDMATDVAVSHTTSVQSLQRLVLHITTADSFAALPKTLTQLSINFREDHLNYKVLTRSTTTAISTLTALQSLSLPLSMFGLIGPSWPACLICELEGGCRCRRRWSAGGQPVDSLDVSEHHHQHHDVDPIASNTARRRRPCCQHYSQRSSSADILRPASFLALQQAALMHAAASCLCHNVPSAPTATSPH